MTSILLGAFTLFEGSILLKNYNQVFLNKFSFKKNKFFLFLIPVFLVSCFVSITIYLYVQNEFKLDINFFEILIITFFFLLVSTFTWFLNIKAYSNFSSFKYLITTLCSVILFFIMLMIIVNFEEIIIWSILLLPISFCVINYSFLKWS
jgi:hypothetical protein